MPKKKNDNFKRFTGFYPRWVYSPREDITRANMRQYDREQAEYYAIIAERYGSEWYEIPWLEKQKLREEIRREAKERCR